MKSIIIKPDKSLIFICLAISSAASRLVSKAVLSTFFCLIELPEFISIAGKYIVLMPNTAKGGGISRKIFNPADRKKIRSILNEIQIPKEMGLIVRTAGSNKTKNEIDHDLSTLVNSWNQIKENALSSIAPSLIPVSYTHLTLPTKA